MNRQLLLALFASVLLLALGFATSVNASNAHALQEVEVDVASDAAPTKASVPTPVSSVPDFVPTDDWQTVLPGQAIPPGLWVRMDMTTGLKTARLLPKEDDKSQQQDANERAVLLTEQTSDATPSGPTIKVLPEPGAGSTDVDDSISVSDEAVLMARRDRIQALKDHFFLKEDAEQMKQLLSICVDPSSSVPQVVQALEYLEEYLHQIDNAVDFSTMGGLDVVLTFLQQKNDPLRESVPTESSSNDRENSTTVAPPAPFDLQAQRLYSIQAHAAWVLGTSAQNNPKVQERCRKERSIQVLTELYRSVLDEQLAEDSDSNESTQSEPRSISVFQLKSSRFKVLAKLLYALSAILRNNARNQAVFQQLNGAELMLRTESLAHTWQVCQPSSQTSALNCLLSTEAKTLKKLRDVVGLKSLNLLHDFVTDHTVNSVENSSAAGIGGSKRANADMSDIKLFQALTAEPFCHYYMRAAMIGLSEGGPSTADETELSHSELNAREQGFEVIEALLAHMGHAGLPAGEGVCLSVWRQQWAQLNVQLQRLSGQHTLWATKAAEQEASHGEEGIAKYHLELRDAVHRIRQSIQP